MLLRRRGLLDRVLHVILRLGGLVISGLWVLSMLVMVGLVVVKVVYPLASGRLGRGVAYTLWTLAAVGLAIAAVTGLRRRARLVAERNRPCVHGTTGAFRDYSRCDACLREAAAREEERRLAYAQQMAKTEQQRQKAYADYVARVRSSEYLRQMDPRGFEHLICNVYRRIGFLVEETPYSGDSGIDGYMRREGKLYLLQCKRVKGSVGRPVLQQLYGCMNDHQAAGGVVVTTGSVSGQARRWARGKKIEIVEMNRPVAMVRDTFPEGGVVPSGFTAAGDNRGRCLRCGLPLRVVKSRSGSFLGCTGYPACRYAAPLGGRQRGIR